MATEIKVWEVVNGELREVGSEELAPQHMEKDLEQWVAKNPTLLGEDLLVIKRQLDVPQVGRLDLLCIDRSGTLVIVEFKRSMTSREAVAQALDYASWLDSAQASQIEESAETFLEKPLAEAFIERFQTQLQAVSPQNHRVLVVAPRLDASAERIINYLAERHEVDINAVFFKYAKTATGQEILVRTVLVPESARVGPRRGRLSVPQLLALAAERGVEQLVNICRKGMAQLKEDPGSYYGGSFRYWLKGCMICGVNVAGERRNSAGGELDVWVPFKVLAEVTGVPEQQIRQTLKSQLKASDAGVTDLIVRLVTVEQAERLVAQLQQWVGGQRDDAALVAHG